MARASLLSRYLLARRCKQFNLSTKCTQEKNHYENAETQKLGSSEVDAI